MTRFAFVALLIAGCSPTPPPSTSGPGASDAGPPSTCADVCAREQQLGCIEGTPTMLGVTCVQVCDRDRTILRWNLDCRAHIVACADLDKCENDWKDSARPAK